MQRKRSVVPVCQLDAPRLISHPPLKFSSVGPTQPNPTPSTSSYLSRRPKTFLPPPYRASQPTLRNIKDGVSQPSSFLEGATSGNINFFGGKLRPLLVAPNVNTRGGRSVGRPPSPRNANHNDEGGEKREIAAPLEIPSLNRSIKMCGWLKSRVRQCRHPRPVL